MTNKERETMREVLTAWQLFYKDDLEHHKNGGHLDHVYRRLIELTEKAIRMVK